MFQNLLHRIWFSTRLNIKQNHYRDILVSWQMTNVIHNDDDTLVKYMYALGWLVA